MLWLSIVNAVATAAPAHHSSVARRVSPIDGRTIGSGEIGPWTRLIADLYRTHARKNGVPVV